MRNAKPQHAESVGKASEQCGKLEEKQRERERARDRAKRKTSVRKAI